MHEVETVDGLESGGASKSGKPESGGESESVDQFQALDPSQDIDASRDDRSPTTDGSQDRELQDRPEDRSLDTEESEDRVTIRFAVPPAVSAAIDEARDLHNAVSGSETSVAEFVEALLAEAFAGPAAPLVNESWIGARPSLTERETRLEQETDRWSFLWDVPLEGEELCDASRTLAETARLCREAEAGSGSPDSLIRSLLRIEHAIETSLGDLLARMGESGAWRGLRFSGVGHYAEERLGISRTQAQDRARLAHDLRERPLLRSALEEARLGWEAASLISRIVRSPAESNEGIEAAWIDRAAESTIKRLRDELRMLDRDRALRPREGAIPPIDDATWQASRVRRPGRSLERIAELGMHACAFPASSMVIRFRLPIDLASLLLSAVWSKRDHLEKLCREMKASETRGISGVPEVSSMQGASGVLGVSSVSFVFGVLGASEVPGVSWNGTFREEPGLGSDGARPESWFSGTDSREPAPDSRFPPSLLAARMFSARTGFVPEWCALLALIEDFVATWDDPRQSPRRAGDRIYVRDGWRCSAPGCTSRRNLEEHHIVYRSRGGGDEPSNRVTLCRFHHQLGEHSGLLRCRGRAPLGILWWMGRDGMGGVFRNERRL